jgi:molybdopterin-guanine dinucleotide biosynthesis protein B
VEQVMRIIGLAGWSGAGKTTLLSRLMPRLIGEGARVSVIKQAHHGFDLDKPGKDSWIHREAGAAQVLISSAKRWALLSELRDEPEPSLFDLLAKMASVDYVIIEGFKSQGHRKIEVHRAQNAKPLMFQNDPNIIAIATDALVDSRLPIFDLDDIPAIADFIKAQAEDSRELLARVTSG